MTWSENTLDVYVGIIYYLPLRRYNKILILCPIRIT